MLEGGESMHVTLQTLGNVRDWVRGMLDAHPGSPDADRWRAWADGLDEAGAAVMAVLTMIQTDEEPQENWRTACLIPYQPSPN